MQLIYTIGEHGSPWTPDEARKAALEALGRARRGEDRNTERKAAKAALTVSDLIDHYLTEGPAMKPAKRRSSWVSDGSNLNRHIRPLWGIEHGYCKTNPFAGTTLATAPVRERFLTKDEAIAFLTTISRLESAGNIADDFAEVAAPPAHWSTQGRGSGAPMVGSRFRQEGPDLASATHEGGR